jgi:hypothetical protein
VSAGGGQQSSDDEHDIASLAVQRDEFDVTLFVGLVVARQDDRRGHALTGKDGRWRAKSRGDRHGGRRAWLGVVTTRLSHELVDGNSCPSGERRTREHNRASAID